MKMVWKNHFASCFSGWTALHWACQNAQTALAKAVLDCEADVSCYDRNGQTPLHVAIVAGSLECALILIDHCSTEEVDRVDKKRKMTPLQLLFSTMSTLENCQVFQIVEKLLAKGI